MPSPTRQRSRSPRRRSASPPTGPAADRRRSRSPRRRRSPPRQPRNSGFKWKSKPSNDSRDGDSRDGDSRDDRRGGYEGRGGRGGGQDSYRPSRYRDDRDRERKPYNRDSPRDRERERDREDTRRPNRPRQDKEKVPDRVDGKPTESRKSPPPKSTAPVAPSTFIIVTVNDRLGTKASIPCLPSDTVGDFKKLVAAHIGRQPHEIMLKRQGERPFKDIITLEDYGVSNGVQLDLELDTGD